LCFDDPQTEAGEITPLGRALTQLERFLSFCLAGDETHARALLDLTPELLAPAPKSMVLMAAGTGRLEAVRLVLDLGFNPNYIEPNPEDWQAPLVRMQPRGNAEAVRISLAQGALEIRDLDEKPRVSRLST
jgi:hypothetical protein